MEARERKSANTYLEQECQDIMDNYNPKIERLRKKRKIIIADKALKDLI